MAESQTDKIHFQNKFDGIPAHIQQNLFDINLQGTDLAMNNANRWVWHKIHIGNWWKQFESHVFIAQLTKPKHRHSPNISGIGMFYVWPENWCCALRVNFCIACGNFIVFITSFHVVVALAPYYCYCCCHGRSSHAKKINFTVNCHPFCVFHVFLCVARSVHWLILCRWCQRFSECKWAFCFEFHAHFIFILTVREWQERRTDRLGVNFILFPLLWFRCL